jgi:hypothetical protein
MHSLQEPGTHGREARKAKLRKREIALAFGISALAAVLLGAILSDGFGGPGSSFANDAAPKTESRSPPSR